MEELCRKTLSLVQTTLAIHIYLKMHLAVPPQRLITLSELRSMHC